MRSEKDPRAKIYIQEIEASSTISELESRLILAADKSPYIQKQYPAGFETRWLFIPGWGIAVSKSLNMPLSITFLTKNESTAWELSSIDEQKSLRLALIHGNEEDLIQGISCLRDQGIHIWYKRGGQILDLTGKIYVDAEKSLWIIKLERYRVGSFRGSIAGATTQSLIGNSQRLEGTISFAGKKFSVRGEIPVIEVVKSLCRNPPDPNRPLEWIDLGILEEKP